MARIPVFTVVLLLYSLTSTEGFIPNRKRLAGANFLFSGSGATTTHKGMTRYAILGVAATILTESSPPPESSSQSVQALISSYYVFDSILRQIVLSWELNSIIEYINRYNAKVDYKSGEVTVAGAHFDSEQFESGQKRLRCFRKAISEEILKGNYDIARKYTGRMLHTLQDFYSHTNWIENWMDGGNDISIYHVLGDFDLEIENTVSKSIPTCSDCTKTGSLNFLFKVARFFGIFVESTTCYNCVGNLDSFLKEQKMLTSGYYEGGRDDENKIISKPRGKCSHGGIFDGSTDDSAKGGINKDSTHPKVASHSDLHRQAVDVAEEHSMQMLLKIRQDINNDEMFIEFLGLNENKISSISLILMEINSVILQEISQLFSQIGISLEQLDNIQYNLVSLLDGGMCDMIQVDSIDQLIQLLQELSQLNAQNTTEDSLKAIMCAAKVSTENSPIFVFSDDDFVSDQQLLGEVEAMVAEKNLEIIVVSDSSQISKRSVHNRKSKSHYKRQSSTTDVYQELADFSDGQSIQIPVDEISDIGPVVFYSTTQSSNTIYRHSTSRFGFADFFFFVNSYAYKIMIYLNGQNINVSVYTPQGNNAITLTQYSVSLDSNTTYIATVNITESALFGEWRFTVQSQGSYSILIKEFNTLIVYVDTLTITSNNTYDVVDVKPLEGDTIIVEFTIRGSIIPVAFDTMNIVNDLGIIQHVENTTVVGNNTYVGFFIPPTEEFKIQVLGTDDNGFRFSYISDTSIEPTTISLQIAGENNPGYVILEPGSKTDVTATLFNSGNNDNFAITLDTDALSDELQYFDAKITPNFANLQQGSTISIVIELSLMPNAPNYFSTTFTLVARSSNNADINDFVTFDLANIQKITSIGSSGVSLELSLLGTMTLTLVTLVNDMLLRI